MKRVLTKKQETAYKVLLDILQKKGKQYVYTQGQNIEWFTVEEIDESPFYEIKYINEGYVKVNFHTHKNGYQQFVLILDDDLCNEKIITEEENDYFFEKEFTISTFVMKCLNEMFQRKKDVNGVTGFLSLRDCGTPLYDFRKEFILS